MINTNSKFNCRATSSGFRYLLVGLIIFISGAAYAGPLTAGGLTLESVAPRIFTPNNDGFNDKALFRFTNPEMLPIAGKIYDISGAEVGSLAAGTDPSTMMLWDGKDSHGQTVPAGVYIFKIEFQGEIITGSVVVAR
jgi:hypothetical protein